jgi:hypothetical protein
MPLLLSVLRTAEAIPINGDGASFGVLLEMRPANDGRAGIPFALDASFDEG